MLRATIDYLLDICLRHKIFCLSDVRQLFVPVGRSKKPNDSTNYLQLSQVYPAKITSQRRMISERWIFLSAMRRILYMAFSQNRVLSRGVLVAMHETRSPRRYSVLRNKSV